jgi:hypothetical protein
MLSQSSPSRCSFSLLNFKRIPLRRFVARPLSSCMLMTSKTSTRNATIVFVTIVDITRPRTPFAKEVKIVDVPFAFLSPREEEDEARVSRISNLKRGGGVPRRSQFRRHLESRSSGNDAPPAHDGPGAAGRRRRNRASGERSKDRPLNTRLRNQRLSVDLQLVRPALNQDLAFCFFGC